MFGSGMGDGGRKAGAEWEGVVMEKKQEAVFVSEKRQDEWSSSGVEELNTLLLVLVLA